MTTPHRPSPPSEEDRSRDGDDGASLPGPAAADHANAGGSLDESAARGDGAESTLDYSREEMANDNLPTPTPLVPSLRPLEKMQVVRRTAISAIVVHEAVREEGERELERPVLALTASGLAAGLSMGFSMVVQGLLASLLPQDAWASVVASAGYSVGFVIVVLGRQQLFTENTLTVILPLFAQPSWHLLGRVARLWGVVLLANLVGAFIFALICAHAAIFSPHAASTIVRISLEEVSTPFGTTVIRGVFAGWLIALMVWLLPGAETARLQIILIITYVVALGKFTHIIAGSTSMFYLVSLGRISWGTCLGGFIAPTLLGNIIGGIALVAALNFAQVVTERHRRPTDATEPSEPQADRAAGVEAGNEQA